MGHRHWYDRLLLSLHATVSTHTSVQTCSVLPSAACYCCHFSASLLTCRSFRFAATKRSPPNCSPAANNAHRSAPLPRLAPLDIIRLLCVESHCAKGSDAILSDHDRGVVTAPRGHRTLLSLCTRHIVPGTQCAVAVASDRFAPAGHTWYRGTYNYVSLYRIAPFHLCPRNHGHSTGFVWA